MQTTDSDTRGKNHKKTFSPCTRCFCSSPGGRITMRLLPLLAEAAERDSLRREALLDVVGEGGLRSKFGFGTPF